MFLKPRSQLEILIFAQTVVSNCGCGETSKKVYATKLGLFYCEDNSVGSERCLADQRSNRQIDIVGPLFEAFNLLL